MVYKGLNVKAGSVDPAFTSAIKQFLDIVPIPNR